MLRYGNTRDLVLGLEVVLADGCDLGRPARPAQGQHRLRPAQLFIGSEGTLGVITAAMLKLFPLPRAQVDRARSGANVAALRSCSHSGARRRSGEVSLPSK